MRQLHAAAPYYLPLLIPVLLSHGEAYDSHGHAFLCQCWQEKHDEQLAIAWIRAVHTARGAEEARKTAREIAFEPRSLPACLHMTAMLGKEEPLTLASRQWQSAQKNYACSECGAKFVDMRWQCPQCHEWGSIRPIKDKDSA